MATIPTTPATGEPTVPTVPAPVSTDEKPLPGALLRLRKYPADSTRPELVLCCSENAYDLELSSSAAGVIVYSEMLDVPKSKAFTGRLELYVHRLKTPIAVEGQAAETVALSCDGLPGADCGEAADAKSGPGNPAWNMNVYVEDCSPSSLDNIKFSARGGKGGDGRNSLFDTDKPLVGAGTAGADGGNGGKIQLLLGSVFGRAILLGRSILDVRVDAAANVEVARKLFGEHIAAVGNFIDFCRTITLPSSDGEFKLQLSSLEVLLTYPWIEYPLQQERSIICGILSKLGVAADEQCLKMTQRVEISGGIWGVGGNGALNRSASGKRGQPGSAVVDFNVLIPRATCQRSMPFAHPDQCSMVLETAKFYYFQASLVRASPETGDDKTEVHPKNEPLEQCYITLSRLQNRLLFLDTLKAEDTLYKAYKDAEYNMRIMPRAGAQPTEDISAIASLKAIQNETDLMLRQISAQVDFYGHPSGYVPRASHKFYSTLLDPLLDILKVAEAAHLNYFQQSTQAEQKKQAIYDIEAQIEKSIIEHKKAVEKLKTFMTTQIELAKMLHTKMKAAQEKLQQDMKSIAKELSSLSPWPGLSLMDFVEAATTICFCPNPAMAGVQATGLLVKGITNAGIRNADGEYVDKTLLVEKIKTIEGDADSIVAACQEVKSSGSKLNLDDPSATKLVVKKEEVMKLFKGFKNKFEEKQLKDLDSSFQTYIDVTTERNTAILLYNSAFDSWLQTQESIKYLRSKKGDVQTTINGSDPDLAAVALYMERSYKETLRYVLEVFYLAQKSLWFWSLDNRNYLGEKLGNNVVTNLTYATLNTLKGVIIEDLQKNTEKHGQDMQKFTGFELPLDNAQLLDLKTHGKTVVRVPTNSTGMNGKGFCFKDMNGVRLTKVRFFVPGATSTTNIVRVTLLHMGQETIVDVNNVEHDFQHEKIRTHFQYRLDLAPKFPEDTDGTIDGDIGKETGSDYALVGPFTTWHVEVGSPDGAAVVDLGGVNKAYFSFHGYYYSKR